MVTEGGGFDTEIGRRAQLACPTREAGCSAGAAGTTPPHALARRSRGRVSGCLAQRNGGQDRLDDVGIVERLWSASPRLFKHARSPGAPVLDSTATQAVIVQNCPRA